MMIVYKIEDFVISDMFKPYAPDFINAEMFSYEFEIIQKTIESKLRKRPEIIIELLEEMPETKKHVFDRMRKFGGVKFYKYLNMETELIKYVKNNLEERG